MAGHQGNKRVVDLSNFRNLKMESHRAAERGWAATIQDPAWEADHPVCIYTVDTKTMKLAAGLINWSDILQLQADAALFPMQSVIDTMSVTMRRHSESSPAKADKQRAEMTLCAALYATRTQAFGLLKPFEGGVHFVVMGYPAPGDDYLLRPFAFRSEHDGKLADLVPLFGTIDDVIAQDRVNHPEWFMDTAMVLPFKSRVQMKVEPQL